MREALWSFKGNVTVAGFGKTANSYKPIAKVMSYFDAGLPAYSDTLGNS